MKKYFCVEGKILCGFCIFFSVALAKAQGQTSTQTLTKARTQADMQADKSAQLKTMTQQNTHFRDTIKNLDIEELVVISSPKENRKLRQQPLSVSLVSKSALEENRVFSMKGLSGLVPNLFIPDYGSKLTSSIYIRGVGSRINSSAVGIYIDGVPYYDKSAFDFDFSDIERVDVLRGPQGTLFGLNSMGGLINVHTKSPFTYSGTDVLMSAASKNSYRFSLTHYHRISNRFAFSAGGFGNCEGGFYKNSFNGKNIDKGSGGGGRMHFIFIPIDNLKLDLNVSYEYSDYKGYPYGAYDKSTGKYSNPNYNFSSGYYRNLLNTGFTATYTAPLFTLTSVTGWQHLRDRMSLDQDFSPKDLYSMLQLQKQNTVSEEITLKSKPNKKWDSSTGASFFYQWQRVEAPLDFGKVFISMLQRQMDAAMSAAGSRVSVLLTDTLMHVPGLFYTPTFGAAIFHQSVLKNIFGIEGLSATFGLRLDYEKVKIDYNTSALLNYDVKAMGATVASKNYKVSYSGDIHNSYTPLLPKFALKYDFGNSGAGSSGSSSATSGMNSNAAGSSSHSSGFSHGSSYATAVSGNVYLLVSRGYRGGGYNTQMLSDYLQNDLQRNAGELINDSTVNSALRYKPEYSWNYEAGAHLSFLNNRIIMDMSMFYMKIKNQQVSRFVSSGLGRYTSNAGKSRSCGVEFSMTAAVTSALTLSANYGYTNAKFKKNITNKKVYAQDGSSSLETIDYKDNYVPYSPRNTFSLKAQYTAKPCRTADLRFSADWSGAGKIYFTEANDVSQKLYGLLNADISLQLHNLFGGAISFGAGTPFGRTIEISLWCRNILNKDYAVFYFDSGAAGFMQKGRGIQAGIDLRFKF